MQIQQKIMQKHPSTPTPTSKITDSHPNLDKQIKTKQVSKQIQHDE